MGYDIRPIEEINTFDYTKCIGVQNAETVRRSIDGQFFIVEGEEINAYTHSEMLEITQGENWQIQE